jgi:hypothetical protein
MTMVVSQWSSEAECSQDFIWEDFINEDFTYEDAIQYGKETEEFRPGHDLREQPLPFRSRLLLLLVLIKSP